MLESTHAVRTARLDASAMPSKLLLTGMIAGVKQIRFEGIGNDGPPHRRAPFLRRSRRLACLTTQSKMRTTSLAEQRPESRGAHATPTGSAVPVRLHDVAVDFEVAPSRVSKAANEF